VGRAEEVAAGRDLADRIQAQRRLVDLDGAQELGHHLEHLDVEDEFFEGRAEPAFQPTGPVQDDVGVAHDRAPERHLGLVGRLGVDQVGRVGVRRTVRQAVAPRQLPAGQGRFAP